MYVVAIENYSRNKAKKILSTKISKNIFRTLKKLNTDNNSYCFYVVTVSMVTSWASSTAGTIHCPSTESLYPLVSVSVWEEVVVTHHCREMPGTVVPLMPRLRRYCQLPHQTTTAWAQVDCRHSTCGEREREL